MKKERVSDGYFRIETREKDILLTVYPPVGDGKRVSVNEVIVELQSQGISHYDLKAIALTVSERSGKPVRIAGKPIRVSKNKAIIKISENKMSATAAIIPPAGNIDIPTLLEDIKDDLAAAGVVFGINEEVIKHLLEEKVYNEPVVVAKGRLPADGEDAKLEYFFNTDKKRTPFMMSEDGCVDFRELGVIQTVNEGDVLVKKIPAKKGIPGMTVTGETIPANDGKDVPLPKGKNVYISEDGTELIATTKGQILWDGSRLDIDPVCRIKGDICFETGNVYFNGKLFIDGNIREGFTVKADEDIEIKGMIEKALVESIDGNITVHGGIVGVGPGKVQAKDNITAKFIQNAEVSAGGNVTVAEFILHSQVDAGGSIFVTKGRKGAIIGGKIRARKEVWAKVIGNIAETLTIVQVGIDPKMRDEIIRLNKELENLQEELKKAIKDVNSLKAMKERMGALPPEKEEAYQYARSMQVAMASEIKYIKTQIVTIQREIEAQKGGKICGIEIIYPRVRLAIGKAEYETKEIRKNVCFFSQLGTITFSSITERIL